MWASEYLESSRLKPAVVVCASRTTVFGSWLLPPRVLQDLKFEPQASGIKPSNFKSSSPQALKPMSRPFEYQVLQNNTRAAGRVLSTGHGNANEARALTIPTPWMRGGGGGADTDIQVSLLFTLALPFPCSARLVPTLFLFGMCSRSPFRPRRTAFPKDCAQHAGACWDDIRTCWFAHVASSSVRCDLELRRWRRAQRASWDQY
ncbi:hypothetical protein B0H14DRAFT_2912558, partial [Mycena olivaceomarginata]